MGHSHYIQIPASIGSPLVKVFLVCMLAFGLCGFLIGPTNAAFTASATIDDNSVTTAVISPPPFVPGTGDVVVNEIAWMGSATDADDEWVELRNMTSETIDLTGWKVDGLGLTTTTVVIPSGTLAPNGYFLVGNFASNFSAVSDTVTVDYVTTSVSLVNGGEQLTLKNATDTVIDQTPTGAWVAGEHAATKKSMERNSVPGDGTLAASWHTCVDAGCNDATYWDVEGTNYGTPRATNLSVNDQTSEDFDPLPVYIISEEVPPVLVETATSTESVATVEDEEEGGSVEGGEGSSGTIIGDGEGNTEMSEDPGDDGQTSGAEAVLEEVESVEQEESPESDGGNGSDTGESSDDGGASEEGDIGGASGGSSSGESDGGGEDADGSSSSGGDSGGNSGGDGGGG